MEWPEPVERVAGFLRAAGAEARLEEFAEETPTAEDAAAAVGCDLAQIVKSVVFRYDGGIAVVLVPGDRRADAGKVASALGVPRAWVARRADVEAATGFAPGAVAPFPLPRVARVLIERTLLAHERVWVGAGSERHLAGLAPDELVRLSRAQPMDAVEGGA
ncbi:MAG: YbaK/EbsC family protein [Thermoleophilia bacterium]|nr:YbaK/EbsC family protein [Thermoleophilia bacterium]